MIWRKRNNETKSNWLHFPKDLLDDGQSATYAGDVQQIAKQIIDIFAGSGIRVELSGATIGPRYTVFSGNVRSPHDYNRSIALDDNIAKAIDAEVVNIKVDDGKLTIEVPNLKPAAISLSNIIHSDVYQEYKKQFPIILGRDVLADTILTDLGQTPHLLIAGMTHSGKSSFIGTTLINFLMHYSPDEMRLILIDPKRVELSNYQELPHLLFPIIPDGQKFKQVTKWIDEEMARRSNWQNDNEHKPKILIVCDEVSDLMCDDKDFYDKWFTKIANEGAKLGIHLILATSTVRPEVLTKNIRKAIPYRIGFNTSLEKESEIIIGQPGAEHLLGNGDMLFKQGDSEPIHIQAPYISYEDIDKVIHYILANTESNL